MPSGGGEGQARGDRVRETGKKHDRALQRAIDETRERGELPSYNDDSPSEISVTRQGLGAKLGLPRMARMAIGFGLGFLLVCCGVWLLLRAWKG